MLRGNILTSKLNESRVIDNQSQSNKDLLDPGFCEDEFY